MSLRWKLELKNLIFSVTFLNVLLNINFSYSRKVEDGRIIEFRSFEDFKSGLSRTYFHDYDEVRSRRAYDENVQAIRAHNDKFKKGEVGFRMRTNCMADIPVQRYKQRFVRLIPSQRYKDQDPSVDREIVGAGMNDPHAGWTIPEELDWRKKGFVMPPDDQGQCGGCYAFSVARSMSGQIFKRTGKLINLSVQQLVDCSASLGNKGCIGGSLRNTLRYLEKIGGLMREQDYQYAARQQKCQFIPDLAVVNVTSWHILPAKDEEAIKFAVTAVGPVPVSLNAAPQSFQLYSDGVYDASECTSDSVNHAMLVVGFTKDYWILKNWWGRDWGEEGYMRLKRGRNLCGIANYAAYALV